MSRYDAVVIGAGPAGATAALALARAGWSVAVVERAPYPRSKVCGEYVPPATLALLGELGVADVAADAGPEVRRIAVWERGNEAVAPMPRSADRRAPYGRAIARGACDATLLAHALAAGAALWQPYRACRLRGIPGDYACDIASAQDAATLRARCVIAAHGSWEAGGLPTQAPRVSAGASDLLGFKAYFAHARLPRDMLALVPLPGGYAGLVHTGGAQVNVSLCIRRDALAACRARHPGRTAGEALLETLEAHSALARGALHGAQRAGPWLACGPLRPGARGGAREAVYRIGNAAGEAHPVVGEGVTMAIRSALLLADALKQGRGDDWQRIAAAYEAQWQRRYAGRLRTSAAYARLAMHPACAASAAWLFSRMPSLLTLGARWCGKG